MPTALADHPHATPPAAGVRPIDLLSLWPTSTPLACLVSAGGSPWARWSIFAAPTRTVRCEPDDPDPIALLARTIDSRPRHPAPAGEEAPPFVGGWIGWLSYDLGRVFEPAVQMAASGSRARNDRRWPLFELHECPAAYIHDAERGRWSIVGDARRLPILQAHPAESRVHVGAFAPADETGFNRSVEESIERIRAGDFFQANIAHRLTAEFIGSPRAAARRLLNSAHPWFGAYIESHRENEADRARHAICSASPELFLSFDPITRRVVTRPIKGTRPASPAALQELTASAKDSAELTMIVDLMRNDLGRVCEYGSVRVDDPRTIESHAGAAKGASILHGVATVSGTLRSGLGIADLLRAAFPPGSVTGAPKVHAMRVIDEREPFRRGPYCGCVGFVSDSGHSMWNVAIRTAAMTGVARANPAELAGTLDYWVGAGIVADSDPRLEWEETLHKASILRKAFPDSFPQATNDAR